MRLAAIGSIKFSVIKGRNGWHSLFFGDLEISPLTIAQFLYLSAVP